MKLKRIIKYILGKQYGVPGNQMAKTHVNSIVLGRQGEVDFNYATAASATNSAVYDNTVNFNITVGGNPARTGIVYMKGITHSYTVNTDLKGLLEVHVERGSYNYFIYATAKGVTSGTGSFVAPTTGTISRTF